MFAVIIIVLWMGGNMVADICEEKSREKNREKRSRCVEVRRKRNYTKANGRKSA